MKRRGAILAACIVLLAAIPTLRGTGQGTGHAETVCLITVNGMIGPATASYISRAVDEAASQGAQCLIIQLDTPGGLLDPTKEIVQKFLASTVPTVVYVAPQGAQAGSAGCFITLAADVAAMAPATAIGAAHPVEMGGGEIDKTMKEKLENFYSSYIEGIAVKRKRNAEWAKSSVRDSAATTAEKALQMKVIDFIAKDRGDLLKQLDGREVNGKKLKTASATVVEILLSLREKVFQAIAHPQMMLVLTLIVMYGIIGEFTSPGAILPGVAGVIALVLLLYLATALPMNVAGLVLFGVAIALFLIDASKRLSLAYRPLVIVPGAPLTDVADAYLVDPTIVDRVYVVSSLGSVTSSGGSMGSPNGASCT